MSEAPQLENRIIELFSTKLNVQVPHQDTDLLDTGILDSMTFVDLLMNLEQEFGVTIQMDQLEIDHMRSVNKIATFVASQNGLDPSVR